MILENQGSRRRWTLAVPSGDQFSRPSSQRERGSCWTCFSCSRFRRLIQSPRGEGRMSSVRVGGQAMREAKMKKETQRPGSGMEEEMMWERRQRRSGCEGRPIVRTDAGYSSHSPGAGRESSAGNRVPTRILPPQCGLGSAGPAAASAGCQQDSRHQLQMMMMQRRMKRRAAALAKERGDHGGRRSKRQEARLAAP